MGRGPGPGGTGDRARAGSLAGPGAKGLGGFSCEMIAPGKASSNCHEQQREDVTCCCVFAVAPGNSPRCFDVAMASQLLKY